MPTLIHIFSIGGFLPCSKECVQVNSPSMAQPRFSGLLPFSSCPLSPSYSILLISHVISLLSSTWTTCLLTVNCSSSSSSCLAVCPFSLRQVGRHGKHESITHCFSCC